MVFCLNNCCGEQQWCQACSTKLLRRRCLSMRQNFSPTAVRREGDFLDHMLASQRNRTYIKIEHVSECNCTGNANTNADAPTQPHVQAGTKYTVVLDLPLVLTAHQSPVSACRNILTSAISLKSLSIRRSCAGSSTPKPRIRNTPTYTLLEPISRPPHLCAHK